jgi:hypothetical protein
VFPMVVSLVTPAQGRRPASVSSTNFDRACCNLRLSSLLRFFGSSR